MAAEIDPVILELRANLLRYQSDLRKQATDTERQLGRQERAVQRLEKQMLKSSTAISGSLRGIAGTLGTLFTGRELVGLIDGFTRLQNSLKVAGLEGQNLESVQSRLLELSTKYGVSIEALADLFGKSSQAAKELGASQAQLLALTEATSQALLITGTSSQQASGAILGLTQALSSGVVRAEEFNQINEGGLRPLLQAAAASEKYGGSVAKLRSAVLDGKVSSQEFYQAILAGSAQLEGQASKATLTVAGAFEALTSRLTVYIGQAAQTSGATAALAGALGLLADNLDTIIPLLAIIGTALAGRFVAGALAGGVALRSIAAYASIATTSLAGTALAARGAGAALLAAFGGPVGLAITAVVVGLGYLVVKSNEATKATGAFLRAQQASEESTRKATEAVEKLVTAKGKARDAALAEARAEAEAIKQKIASARASVVLAKAELARAKAYAQAQNQASIGATGVPGTAGFIQGQGDKKLAQARGNLDAANKAVATNLEALKSIESAISSVATPAVGGVGDGKSKKKKSGGGPSGPSAAEIEDRFQSELANITQQTLSARQSLATSAEDRAELELRAVESARTEALRSLEAEKTYSEAQKARIRDALENLAEFERERVARDRRRQIEDERQQIEEAEFNARSDSLRNQYDLATTDEQRRQIARQILEAEDAYLRSKLEAVIANQDLTDAVRQQAQIELDALNASAGDRKALVEKANQGALGRYIDSISDTKSRVEEATVRKLEAVNQGITDAIASQLGVKDQFVKDLFSIFLDEVIFRPLAEALRNRQGGGGGLLNVVGSVLGAVLGGGKSTGNTGGGVKSTSKIPGRASGGYVEAGRLYRINEGGAEGFVPANSGQIIPTGRMNARALQASPSQQGPIEIRLIADRSAFVSDVSAISEGQAVKVTMAAAPALTERAVSETMRRANRPRMPGAGR